MSEEFDVRKSIAPYIDRTSQDTKNESGRAGAVQPVPRTNTNYAQGNDFTEAEVSDFSGNEWFEKAVEMKRSGESTNAIGQDGEDYYFGQDEVGIKHPLTGAVVKMTDDGFIDIFADDQLGIRIDPHSKSINILGDTVNVFTKRFNVKTTPNGFIWNDYYFNPQLYFENEKERGQQLTGTKEFFSFENETWHRDTWEVEPMKRSQSSFRYSEGVKEIMKELGLTTPDE